MEIRVVEISQLKRAEYNPRKELTPADPEYQQLGYKQIECSVQNLDKTHEKALNLALNKINGIWDNEKLEKILAELKELEFDMDITGFSADELNEIFNDTLEATEDDFDVEKEFGAKRVKVKAKFDNVDYRGSIVRMGMPCFMIGLTKEIRKKIGKGIGDTVSVEIEKDEEERIVEIPIEFESMLNKNNNAKEFYDSLSYSQKKKYITWITSAKKE